MRCQAKIIIGNELKECDLEENHISPHKEESYYQFDESFRTFEWIEVKSETSSRTE